MLGANIGTTVTGILASMAEDEQGALTIALVHVLFNLVGVVFFFPIRVVRLVPLAAARGLAEAATRNRLYVLLYVVGTFVVLPLCGWLIWRGEAG